ncbi:MAG TPA: HAMP domain-containing sensor histidine kinase [Tepidisphaeraceae bacterium]|jgi:signal transduction histidine kinase|nr:HAMP domain-containing sensor histidine kinase [Tepidisphaeraceae bacterium]
MPAESSASRARWVGVARFCKGLGLEAKIITAVMALLTAALSATCWLWASRIDLQVNAIMGNQARQTAYTLSMAARGAMYAGDVGALRLMGTNLLKSRNILFIAFYDSSGKNIAWASRSAAKSDLRSLLTVDVASLTRIHSEHSAPFGDYLEVCQPVLNLESVGPALLVGYVAVGISPQLEESQVQRVNYFAMGIGCITVLIALPLAYMLVHRIFLPIRQLVDATNRIAAGDLQTAVAIDRSDAIGELARSFNAMIETVKRQQQDLRDANDDLERKVIQRTAQLETANNRLVSEIAEKEDFLRAVSHDLSAPLRNISGMAAMLLMKHGEQFDEEIVHRLQRIQKNVDVETDLISELLELSRIKTRRQKMEMVETAALVRDVEGLFESDLRDNQITLTVDTPMPVLHGERPRFRQVFQNLIDNAIKYMGDGPIREIHIGCQIRLTEAEFYVRDTGLGIDADDQAKVFYVFRRGKNSTSRNIAGKGVGLSSVKSIIETYSGKITVESEPGNGSTFKFTINGRFVPAAQPQARVAR